MQYFVSGSGTPGWEQTGVVVAAGATEVVTFDPSPIPVEVSVEDASGTPVGPAYAFVGGVGALVLATAVGVHDEDVEVSRALGAEGEPLAVG